LLIDSGRCAGSRRCLLNDTDQTLKSSADLVAALLGLLEFSLHLCEPYSGIVEVRFGALQLGHPLLEPLILCSQLLKYFEKSIYLVFEAFEISIYTQFRHV
jgi:hypothetical protein